jgi:hypothetical protein
MKKNTVAIKRFVIEDEYKNLQNKESEEGSSPSNRKTSILNFMEKRKMSSMENKVN